MNRLQGALTRLATDLGALHLRWALVGGMAVSARVRPRTTEDVDVVIAVSSDREAERVAFAFHNRGSGIEHWTALAQAFRALEERPGAHPLMSEVGRHGMRIVEGYSQAAQSRQQEVSLRGL